MVSFVFGFFPETRMPGAESMSWAVVISVFVLTAAGGWYLVGGSKKFVAPVTLVKNQ